MWETLGKYFFNGLITLLPLFVTLWLLYLLFSFADGFLGGIMATIIGRRIPGMGLATAIVLIFFIGFLTTVFGKRLVHFMEHLLYKLPLVNIIYSSVKQINEILFLQRETRAFRRVCAVQYPRKGVYSIGFVTGEGVQELKEGAKKEMLNIFVPTTPSPATGFMVVVPEKEVIMLDMRLDDAIKLIVSGGVLSPPKKGRE